MKKRMLLLTIILTGTTSLYAQQVSPEYSVNPVYKSNGLCLYDTTKGLVKDYNYYRNKSLDQKTGAWLLAVAATGALVTGAVLITNQVTTEADYALDFSDAPHSGRIQTGQYVLIAGAGLAIGSTLLFIQAHKNKRRAGLAMGSQPTSIGLPSHVGRSVQGLTLHIAIDK